MSGKAVAIWCQECDRREYVLLLTGCLQVAIAASVRTDSSYQGSPPM